MKTGVYTRNGVFETNSSSTHSISIAEGDEVRVGHLVPDPYGVLRVYPGFFGWEIRQYKDPTSKAAYCLAWLHCSPNATVHHRKMLTSVLKSVTGARKVLYCKDCDGTWGHIDHQSCEKENDVLLPAWKDSSTLKRFIFHPDSILMTDNDNH